MVYISYIARYRILTVAPFYLIMTAYFGYKAILNNKVNYTLLTENKIRPSRSTFELMCLVTVIASFVVTVIHKVYSKTELFLLQPCHVSAVILIMVMAWPTKFNQFAPQLLFNIYLHTLWGAILALVFPDLRDHDMLGEVFNFFLGKKKKNRGKKKKEKKKERLMMMYKKRAWHYIISSILYVNDKTLCNFTIWI
ncbi:hypothetical protein EDC94DRAFT_237987 [Helicostylum pulchrum]|nr:hypothetical protein EDC94DRAFT_237987 [Helicostylum pulchrum]